MASVHAAVVGGEPQRVKDVETVGDVRARLELANTYTATVNGEPADDDTYLESEQFVSFAQAVKGGSL